MKPIEAKIRSPTEVLLSGKQYSFDCETRGSKPTAIIKWFLNNEEVNNQSTTSVSIIKMYILLNQILKSQILKNTNFKSTNLKKTQI